MKRNILLIFVIIVLSLILAMPFGNLVNKYVFTSSGFATFSIPDDISSFINGLPLVYLLLTTLIFGMFGKSKKWIIAFILAIPSIIFSFMVSTKYLTWSAIFLISGIIIAKIVEFISSKSKQPQIQ